MSLIRGGIIGSIGTGAANEVETVQAAAPGVTCYNADFSGLAVYEFNHELGSEDLVVSFVDASGVSLLPDEWKILNENNIQATFATPQNGSVTVFGCRMDASGIVAGVERLEGLSGIIDLDSPNNSVAISTSGQVINLSTHFTAASGALLEQINDFLLGANGVRCYGENFSGVVTTTINHGLGTEDLIIDFKDAAGNLLVPDNWQTIDDNNIEVEFATEQTGHVSIFGCVSGIQLTPLGGEYTSDGNPVDSRAVSGHIIPDTNALYNLGSALAAFSGIWAENVIATSGSFTERPTVNGVEVALLTDTLGASSVTGDACATAQFTAASGTEFVLYHGLGTEDISVQSWDTSTGTKELMYPQRLSPSGSNHIIVELVSPTSGVLVVQSCGGSGVVYPPNQGVDSRAASGSIVPDTSGAYDLGSSTDPFANVYADDATFENRPTVDGVDVALVTDTLSSSGCATRYFTSTSGTQFVLEHGLSTEDFTFDVYENTGTSYDNLYPSRVAASGLDHVIVELAAPTSGKIVLNACGGGSASISYAASEKITGDVWINGSPIYRTVVEIASLPNATTTGYAHGITFAGVVKMDSIMNNGTQWLATSGVSVDATNIQVSTAEDLSSYSAHVILEYFKA
jgi:hypothetical protein